MSERDDYPAGVPCWITNLQPDVGAARSFYEQLFGWTTVGPADRPESEAGYVVGRLRGRDVAGIGTIPAGPPELSAAWVTEVRVDTLEDTCARVLASGGTVIEKAIEFDEIGRLAVLADPMGAVLCAWQAGLRRGAQLVNEPGAWSMSALTTPDPNRAVEFYHSVFGWVPEPFGPVTLLRLPGYHGGEPGQPVPRDVVAVIAPPGAREAGGSRWDVDFWIGDTDATVAHAARLGGSVLTPPYTMPPFRQAVLADPGGAPFSISQLRAG